MKAAAIIAGILFALLGIAGFIPALCPGGLLFGVLTFHEIQGIVYIATGVLGLLLGFGGAPSARTFFRIFGIVYALIAILGFMHVSGASMGIEMNTADNVLHAVLAAIGIAAGFITRRPAVPPRTPGHDLRELA
jgi:hypothetical protein